MRISIEYFVQRNSKLAILFSRAFGIVSDIYGKSTLLPIVWLDSINAEIVCTLDLENIGWSYGPKTIDGSQNIEQIQLPPVNLYHFENAKVAILSSSILFDNKIIIERLEGVDVKRCDFKSGHVLMHSEKNALVRTLQTEHLEKGLFLGGNGSTNYYHWMIEILPKLKYIGALEKHGYDSFPILVSEDVDHIKTFMEALNYVAKDKPIIRLKKRMHYSVGELAFINTPNNLPFNLRQNEKMVLTDFIFRTSSINFLREKMLLGAHSCSSISKGNKRIFFARHKSRRNYNQQEVFDIFSQKGFKPVFMEELNLKEQISLVANAEFIAGPTGAEWANLIFCHKDTKCLCWMASGYGNFSAFSNLAKISGADLRYISFKSKAKTTVALSNTNYFLDTDKIKEALEKLMALPT